MNRNERGPLWHVSVRQDGLRFRVHYQYRYPNGRVEEQRDSRRFETKADAEHSAKEARRMEYFFRHPG